MPPKNIPQRRSRKETLEEDLTKLIDERNTNDEEVFPILKEALNEGVDVNLVVANRSLICYFALWGMIKCFEECFLLCADPTIVTSEFPSDALDSAVRGVASAATSLRMVMSLSNHVKFNEFDQNEAIARACDHCRFEVVSFLLRRNNAFADNVLWWGVHHGSRRLVEIALDFRADVNQIFRDDRYLIHRAAEFQDSSILEKLLDAGADIETKNMVNETPFEVAVRCNSVSCVKLLIDKKCEFCTDDALLLAVRCGSHDVLKELLGNEDIDDLATNELTLLLTAVAQDDLTAFRIIYPMQTFCPTVIHRLVRLGKYDMLSAALFEFEHPGLFVRHLTQSIPEAPNDDFKALLEKKIDVMNGVDLVTKVKKEAQEQEEEEEEEEQQQLQSTSKTKKKTTKTTTKSKKK